MTNGSNGAITDETHTTTKPARGAIAALAASADLTLSVTTEAKRLLALAETQGVTTTVASLKQAIQLRKRKAGGVPHKPVHRKAVMAGRAVDDAIESLENLREYVVGLETTNSDLTLKLGQLHAILKR